MVACGGGGTESDETQGNPEETGNEVERDPVNVNIIVRASEKGENVYESGENGYDFEGDTLTVAAILEEFMDFEYSIMIEFDDSGKLVKVGDLVAESNQFGLFSVAKLTHRALGRKGNSGVPARTVAETRSVARAGKGPDC